MEKAATRVAKNTLILYFRMGITLFISLYSTRLILAALGSSDFGLFNVVGGVISMLGFLNSSMAASTQRFMSVTQGTGDFEKIKDIFNTSTLLHWGIAVLVFVILEVAGFFFFNGILNIEPERIETAKAVYQFMVISTVFTVISVPYEAVLTSHENMTVYAVIGVIESLLKLGIAFCITYTNFDNLLVYGLLMALLSVLLLILKRIYCHRNYSECKIDIKKHYSKPLLKEMGSFAGWSFLGSAAGMLSNYGQGIVLNVFFGTRVNASQGIANQVSGQLGAFSNTMLKALNPVIAKSGGSGDRRMMINSVMMGSKFSFFLLAFFAIPIIIEMPFILNFWLKDVPDFAVIFCRLLLLKNLQDQMFITLGPAIGAIGKIKKYQISISILAFTPLVITWFLFKEGYEPYVLYIVFLIQSGIRSFFITLYHANKNVGIKTKEFLKSVVGRCLLVAFTSFALGVVVKSELNEGYVRLFSVAILCTIISLLGLFFVALKANEKKIIYGVISPILNKLKK